MSRTFFRRRLLAAVALGLGGLGALLLLFAGRPERLYPSASGTTSWNAYDDRSQGGDSRCEALSGGDTLRLRLRTSAAPKGYWGIEWGPGAAGALPERLWSWGFRDSLVFHWRARRAVRLRVFLCSRDPALTVPEDPLSRRYLTGVVPVAREWGRSTLALSDLEPPGWWLSLHPGLPEPRRPFLKSILVLQVGPASGTVGDDTLEIASVERIPAPSARALALLPLLAGGIAAALLWRRRPSAVPPSESSFLPVSPSPLEAPSPDLERLCAFLSCNYARPELDLAATAQETGLSSRRVTALLNGRGEGFKAVLNRLRLEEAKRLLEETDLQVSEIAFKVGYGNVSHFNRVFRERFGGSPGGMRALQKSSDPLQKAAKSETVNDQEDFA